MSHVFRLISYSKISTWSTSWKYRLTNWNVKNVKKRPNFLSQWEQSKDFTPYFLCLYVFKFHKILPEKDEFLITMRAIKSFDTILFVSSCLQMKSNQKFWHHNFCVLKFHKIVSKKGRISYHNESNKKFWHHIFV